MLVTREISVLLGLGSVVGDGGLTTRTEESADDLWVRRELSEPLGLGFDVGDGGLTPCTERSRQTIVGNEGVKRSAWVGI